MKYFLISIIVFCSLSSFCQSDDKGIGLLFFKSSFLDLNYVVDSVEISDLSGNRKIGAFIFNTNSESIYSLKIIGLENTNLVEFDYEIKGLPIAEVISRDKIKVILGKNENSQIVYGIISNDKYKLEYTLWEQLLFSKPLFFINSKDIRFYTKPNGVVSNFTVKNLSIDPEEGNYNYIMYPLEICQNWMKVEVVSPSDFCEFPDKVIKHTLWIKYLDSKRNPLVWYYIRGC